MSDDIVYYITNLCYVYAHVPEYTTEGLPHGNINLAVEGKQIVIL